MKRKLIGAAVAACIAIAAGTLWWLGQPREDPRGRPRAFAGECLYVSDGDTIKVQRRGQTVIVRLYGIDCPEGSQPFGHEAKVAVEQLVLHQRVKVVPVNIDRYGRTVGRVVSGGGVDVGQQMVANGMAWWYVEYARKDADLQSAELSARSRKVGLWATNDPQPPWQYRRSRREQHKARSQDDARGGTRTFSTPQGSPAPEG